MSSAVVPTSAALGRPFVFDPDAKPEVGALSPTLHDSAVTPQSRLAQIQSTIKNQQSKIPPSSVTPASQLEVRPAPEMASSGIPELDALTGGLPRGCLTEICGCASSGRTTVLLAALAAATRRGEYCAVIDASDALDPQSMADSGVDLDRFLWVRCGDSSPQRHRGTEKNGDEKTGYPIPAAPFAARVGISSQAEFAFDRNTNKQSEHRLEQVLRATDLLLESGGFGLIILDLADLPIQSSRRIPLTTWFRFRRSVEHKPTILLAIEQQPIAGSCSSLLLQLRSQEIAEKETPGEPMLLKLSNSSHEAAAWESPARQCRVERESRAESRRDGTVPVTDCDANNATHAQYIVHPTHAQLFTGLDVNAALICSRLDRKPVHSIAFATKTAWAG